MDAIAVLTADHRTVEGLFAKYESFGPRAVKGRREVVDRMIKELSIHTAIEEVVLYPAIREAVGKGEVDDMVLEALEEHHVAKWTLKELEDLEADHERFDPKVTVLMEQVRHHVKEEEKDLFPKLRKIMDKEALQELGEALVEFKRTAPDRPHPKMPDEPPGNLLTGPAAAMADKALEAGRRLIGKAS